MEQRLLAKFPHAWNFRTNETNGFETEGEEGSNGPILEAKFCAGRCGNKGIMRVLNWHRQGGCRKRGKRAVCKDR